MKYRLPLMLFLSIFWQVRVSHAQFLNSTYPVNPGSSGLLSEVDQPVTLNTGSVGVNLPLFEIGTKMVKLPISLSYGAKGIKVADEASNVGLGWDLVAGGRITRVIHGLPDDMGKGVGWHSGIREGRFWNAQADNVNNFPVTGTAFNTLTNICRLKDSSSPSNGIYNLTSPSSFMVYGSGYNDTEPDMFYFSFGNTAGKFVFN